MVFPIDKVNYQFLLHGHSHVMFLGWVFNVLIVGFAIEFVKPRWFKPIFIVVQVCVVGMLISFPLQGYGVFSILFSTVHTAGALGFIILFIRALKNDCSLAATSAKAALIFFTVSSLGPFMLAYLKSNGLDHSNLYRFSIYFYLHFQYNGFFTFGVMSLYLKLVETQLDVNSAKEAKIGLYLMMIACVPAYILSVLWARPSIAFYAIAFCAAILHFVGMIFLFKATFRHAIKLNFDKGGRLLFGVSALAFVGKSLLQLLSAIPSVADFAGNSRPILIAYLHLVLVGFVSTFLLGWLMFKRVIQVQSPAAIIIFLVAFVLSEVVLATSPWHAVLPIATDISLLLLTVCSALMVAALAMLVKRASQA